VSARAPGPAPAAAIYRGELRHRRLLPKAHEFTYPVFMAFLDIDRIEELCRVSPFLSHNRWNWASFDERDHVGDPRRPLRERLREDAARAGSALPDGPIYLLTNLRYLGYCFNPVSYFYCYDRNGQLDTVMAEVSNTFGEMHPYWLDRSMEVRTSTGRHYDFDKAFHVSPFMPMDCRYRFGFTDPGDSLLVQVKEWNEGELFFEASLRLARESWSAGALHRALARHPWMTLRVIAAIHWQALRLWAKGVPVFTHPKKLARKVAP
jgi:DUF1365 family protein